jgi:hypothetical protein
MLKRVSLWCGVFLFLFPAAILAQPADSAIEIRLKIIQGTEGNRIKDLALSVSIINHSSDNVYIPYLRLVGYLHDIHLFRRQGSSFEEIDLLGQATTPPEEGTPMFTLTGHAVTRYYRRSTSEEARGQDSIIRVFYDSLHNPIVYPRPHLKVSEVNMPKDQPLFLKARQELDNFKVMDIEHILAQPGEYKICWTPRKNETGTWPSDFAGYRLYPLPMVTANTIYFDSLQYDQVQRQ